jgi:hypothetical protein
MLGTWPFDFFSGHSDLKPYLTITCVTVLYVRAACMVRETTADH